MTGEWLRQAPCVHFPDLFTTSQHQKDAVHICLQHCKVRAQCRKAYEGIRFIDVVIAGRAYGVHGELLEKVHGPGDVRMHNPWCRALEERELAGGVA